MFSTNDDTLEEESLRLLHFFKNEIQNKEIDNNIKLIVIKDSIHVKYNIFIDNNLVHAKEVQITSTSKTLQKRYYKRYAKLALYEALSSYYHVSLAWGSLTGIRPTKLFYELMEEYNNNPYQAKEHLIKDFYVPTNKADICLKIVEQQQGIDRNDKLIDLYINIPFCPSKCYYCSFISAPLSACKDYVAPYIDKLIEELEATKQLIQEGNYIVKSVYIGGGTPTSLSAEQLDEVLSHIGYQVSEFTVECGRPDTITKEKLEILKKYHVTRISINPQTFCNKTLKAIGRDHTSQDIIDCYKMALPFGFDINMDLIAGLNNESFSTFKKSLLKTVELHPDNITVHTLSIKKTSKLDQEGGDVSSTRVVEKMVDYAYDTLTKAGYHPYYLYRQKNMIGNLENIGYCLNGKRCVFNIDSMEEISSVIAVGANAISKRVWSITNKIERAANVKNLNDYITRVPEMIERKRKLFLEIL